MTAVYLNPLKACTETSGSIKVSLPVAGIQDSSSSGAFELYSGVHVIFNNKDSSNGMCILEGGL